MFVAVADNTASSAYSLDGVTWIASTMPVSSRWSAAAYGNGVFVAVAGTLSVSTTIAASSVDGINWVQRLMPSDSNWYAVVYGGGVFVAVAANTTTAAATSTDGVTWTARIMPSSSSWRAIAYGAGIFVATTNGTASATSVNGVAWKVRTLPASTFWYALAYGNGKFVAPQYGSTNIAQFLSSPITITIAGDYTTPPSITINGPVNTPIITNGTSFITSARNLAAGESLIINCNPASPSIYYRTQLGILINDMKNLILTSSFFQLSKGANSITLLCSSASITYAERYAGV
jgi:hypothetical protein